MNDNKRIAVNTFVLYTKLILSVIIGLYVSRLVLLALGIDDFGLYAVVGGIVGMLNILGITMSSTSYRYLSVEIGKGESGDPNKVYNTILVIHIAIALMLLIAGSTIGTWYIDNYLNVLPERIGDAKFVLYVSMITSVFTIIAVPSNGLIIAREKFIFTSSIEIIQSLLKLVMIFFVLTPYMGDKLRLYAVMLAMINIITPITYTLYCNIKVRSITRWKFNRNIQNYKEVLLFTWWLFLGAICVVGKDQGAAVVMNLFFGTVINASFGIAMQMGSSINMFVSNIRQAANPQIMKNLGAGNQERSLVIVYKVSKYTSFIMLLIGIPVLISIDDILKIWLDEVPEYTGVFTSLLIINGLIATMGNGFDALIQATGKIKLNQIGYSLINISLVPIIFLLYKFGFPPYANVFVMTVLTFLTIIFQLYVMTVVSNFNIRDYLKITVFPLIKTVLVISPIFALKLVATHSISSVAFITLMSILWILVSEYYVGLDRAERDIIAKSIVKLTKKRYGKKSGSI